MNKERMFLGSAAGVFLAVVVLVAARELTADSQPSPQLPLDPTLKIQSAEEKLPSEKALEELTDGYRVLSEAIAWPQNVPHTRIQKEAQLLARRFDAKMVFPVLLEEPETTDFKAPRGRFPGTLVVWGSQNGLQVQVPLHLLVRPGITTSPGEATKEVALNVIANWRFAGDLEGTNVDSLTVESVQRRLALAQQGVRADLQQVVIASQASTSTGK